jgi:hypothetical protein
MPAARLGSSPVDVERFDILGIDAAGRANFVAHVGLSANALAQFNAGAAAELIHMQPPLARGPSPIAPQTWATATLTIDEEHRIDLFVDERIEEHRANHVRRFSQYVIRPHAVAHREADGTVVFWLYNCAGFVVEAYRSAGLNFVETDEAILPKVTKAAILAAYPDAIRFQRRWDALGISNDGPWPVLMPGYVLHALARSIADIRRQPYIPRPGDEAFP